MSELALRIVSAMARSFALPLFGGSSFNGLLDVGIVIVAVATIHVVIQLERARRGIKAAVKAWRDR